MATGIKKSFSSRLKQSETRSGKVPIVSPYVPELIICCPKPKYRWVAKNPLTGKHGFHSRAVWEHFNGPIPDGYVVHHKDGNHTAIEDDRPENLMLLTDNQNARLFPALALELGVPESVITECFLKAAGDTKLFLHILSQL